MFLHHRAGAAVKLGLILDRFCCIVREGISWYGSSYFGNGRMKPF